MISSAAASWTSLSLLTGELAVTTSQQASRGHCGVVSTPGAVVMTVVCCFVQLVAADANGEKVVHSSPAADMWALGVLAYEMFAG